MRKWIVFAIVVLVLVAGYIAAGPFVAIKGIRDAIREQDAAELSRHIDFPALRTSFRQQIDGYLAERAGADVQSHPLGSLALRVASGAAGGAADALATPAGLAAVLQGRGVLRRFMGSGSQKADADVDRGTAAVLASDDPLRDARYRFESPSRFTATVDSRNGGPPVVFVLTRSGLRWRISDVRLPLAG